MNSVEMIKDLATAFGAPGFEDDVLNVAEKHLPAGYSAKKDSTLNYYIHAEKQRSGPTLLIDAHSDEVGLMVHYILPNGTIRFTPLGHWSPNVLTGQKMLIKNLDGDFITGVVASRPPHFSKGAESTPDFDNMVLDIGATSKEEVEAHYKIYTACPIVPSTEFEYFVDEDVMISKAFDCRLGCAAVLEVLNDIKGLELGVNPVGVLSAQEEIGIRGARVVANNVKPDICIAFEGTPADDTFAEPAAIQTRLKHGPMLRHIDNGMVTNPRFMRFALDTAKKSKIPFQEAVRLGGSTNGAAYHLSNLGVPTIIIGVPVRYAHSHNSIATLGDYKNSVKLAVEIIKMLNADIIARF